MNEQVLTGSLFRNFSNFKWIFWTKKKKKIINVYGVRLFL